MALISITRALAELKKFENQLSRELNAGRFVAVGFGRSGETKAGETKGKVSSDIESSFDRISRLFSVRHEIKAAIVRANADTSVVVGGVSITVAEAIELKRSVDFKVEFLGRLKQAKLAADRTIEQENCRIETLIQTQLQTLYGNEKGKITPDMYSNVADPIKAAQGPCLIDPRSIEKEIRELEVFVDGVKTELDFALSESNARTLIDVPSLA